MVRVFCSHKKFKQFFFVIHISCSPFELILYQKRGSATDCKRVSAIYLCHKELCVKTQNCGKTPTIQPSPVMLQWSCISGRSKLGRSKLGKKEWKGGSMPFAQLMAVLPLRDVACSLRVPSNSNDLKCNKDENETVIAHRSDCGLFLSPNRKE